MSYLKEITWHVVPTTIPKVNKNCSKCGKASSFINTEKFRVNANKNKLDVWLIYQCEKCKSTWNMTIHERISPKTLSEKTYQAFLENDKKLALDYGFDKAIHMKNKVSLDYEAVTYRVEGQVFKPLYPSSLEWNQVVINITCEKPFELRMDRLLGHKLELSRNQIKNLYKENILWSDLSNNLLKEKIHEKLSFRMKVEKA